MDPMLEVDAAMSVWLYEVAHFKTEVFLVLLTLTQCFIDTYRQTNL